MSLLERSVEVLASARLTVRFLTFPFLGERPFGLRVAKGRHCAALRCGGEIGAKMKHLGDRFPVIRSTLSESSGALGC